MFEVMKHHTPYYTVLASKTGTTTTTPQIKNLIGRMRKNTCAAREGRTLEQFCDVLCKIISAFAILVTT